MKIVFNVHDVGLGNNGGSRTIIRSAQTLINLGHEVYIAGSINRATWWKPDVPFVKKIPECDAIIATGYHSVKSSLKFKNAKTHLWYVRGHEVWQAKDEELWKMYASYPNIITNVGWIHKALADRSIESKIIYQGIDYEDFYKCREPDLVIGGLHHKKASKRSQDCLEISKRSGFPLRMLNRDFSGGEASSLRNFYGSCAVWISSSENEGLQNVPIEATLCGAALVLTDHHMGGTSDYAIHEKNCLIYPARNLKVAANHVKNLMQDQSLRKRLRANAEQAVKEVIGTRSRNMTNLVSHIEDLIAKGK